MILWWNNLIFPRAFYGYCVTCHLQIKLSVSNASVGKIPQRCITNQRHTIFFKFFFFFSFSYRMRKSFLSGSESERKAEVYIISKGCFATLLKLRHAKAYGKWKMKTWTSIYREISTVANILFVFTRFIGLIRNLIKNNPPVTRFHAQGV